jgi:ComF family protein
VLCRREGDWLCQNCQKNLQKAPSHKHPYIYAPYTYSDKSVQKIIKLFKYRQARVLALPIARAMSQNEKILRALNQNLLLIPIPTTKKSERNRGYNQTLVLAKALLPYFPSLTLQLDVLYKKGKEQTKVKTRNERIKNSKGSFFIENTEVVKGKSILLLDDVTTTGSTFIEARRILKKSGAKQVLCLAFAYEPE